MNVTMRINIGGYRNGEEWPAPGGTIDLPDHEAIDLIAAGYATATSDNEVPDAEPIAAPTVDDDQAAVPEPDDQPTVDDDQAAVPEPRRKTGKQK